MCLEMSGCMCSQKSWRHDAVRIVEELFPGAPSEHWNMLLDLREGLLQGADWNSTLDIFLSCREELEADQYLPFYRLRRLLTESLRLEAGPGKEHVTPLKQVLMRKHRSLAEIKRAVSREVFEHDLSAAAGSPLDLRVVEVLR
jgi:hypothetical protein